MSFCRLNSLVEREARMASKACKRYKQELELLMKEKMVVFLHKGDAVEMIERMLENERVQEMLKMTKGCELLRR